MADERTPIWLYVSGGVFVVLIAVVFASSLTRPRMPSFMPGELTARPAGTGFATDTVTLDARDETRWVFFDFDRGITVDPDVDPSWDLAVRRFHLIVNGGEGFAGAGGAVSIPVGWTEVTEAPASGYATTRGRLGAEPSNPALERWYRYSFFAHTLEPRSEVYVLRTAEGGYAKLRLLSYYCPEATPGCVTFEYAHRGDGSRSLVP